MSAIVNSVMNFSIKVCTNLQLVQLVTLDYVGKVENLFFVVNRMARAVLVSHVNQ